MHGCSVSLKNSRLNMLVIISELVVHASRHIHNALQAGATMEEIMEVLKLCVVQGSAGVRFGRPDSG